MRESVDVDVLVFMLVVVRVSLEVIILVFFPLKLRPRLIWFYSLS